MGADKTLSLNEIPIIHTTQKLTVSLFLPVWAFSSPKVLLMQESVRRIIEAEEARMGKIRLSLATG